MTHALSSPRPSFYPPGVSRGVLASSLSLALALGGCAPTTDTSTGGGDAGGGDAGVACPAGPEAMLTLIIKAASGPVPEDTELLVSWSAGLEPTFSLDDPKTWKSLADANLICDVDPALPPPTDLAALVCHLWTSGVTHVQVGAGGYTSYESTLKPKYSAKCKGPVPTDVAVTLALVPDGGSAGP